MKIMILYEKKFNYLIYYQFYVIKYYKFFSVINLQIIQDQDEEEKSFCSDLLTTKTSVQNKPEITESQQQRVNSLMEEAMQESFNLSQRMF